MKQYNITGMSCAACSARVEKAVSAVEGVSSCSVNLLTNSMSVDGNVSDEDIITAVENLGFGASVKTAQSGVSVDVSDKMTVKDNESEEKGSQIKDKDTPMLKKRLFGSVGFLAILMYFSMGHMMFGLPLPGFFEGNPIAVGLVQMLLAIIVMVINQKFFISGFNSLYHKAPNMDTLVALGSSAAFIYSTYALFAMTSAQLNGDKEAVTGFMKDMYFESAAMILTLITVGKMLEARSKGKTTDALEGLMRLAPQTAVILRDGEEVSVRIQEVKKDDVFVVRSGDSIPVDGVVVEGTAAVNEAALTGESIPADKSAGDSVYAATIAKSGYLKCRATKVGEDTSLSKIIQMVSDASATKAPIAKIADKVSGIFVPIVILTAVITAAVWLLLDESVGYALARGISVLVISCPCALGLATPVAVMVGNGVGAKNGILFKTAAALEETGRIKTVVLDKTGTITQGEPKVTDIITYGDISEEELLRVAYAAEQKSEHPLSRAIIEKAKTLNLLPEEVEDFKVFPGNGLSAVLKGQPVCAGNYIFIKNKAEISDTIKKKSEALAQEGKTPLFFSRGNELIGVIAVADVIKEDSPKAVREMQEMGISVVMLTGDNENTANAIGAQVGTDKVISGVLPDGKENEIRQLQKEGKVAMVGDGINDAPALTRADIGMAVGAGTDIAIDAADVVLMKDRLSDVPAAIRLSRATLRNIRQNLFWAFFYNIIGIPVAAGVLVPLGITLSPMLGAAAMSLSSFCVVTNALRLNTVKITGKSSKEKNKRIKHTK